MVESYKTTSFPLAVKEISDLLNTGLNEETLQICVQLLEAGVNPEALAAVVQELRRETAAIKVTSNSYVYIVHHQNTLHTERRDFTLREVIMLLNYSCAL